MNPALLELALRKQRLKLRSADLRQEFAACGAAFAPAAGLADRAKDGVAWVRRHPQALAAAAAVLVAARPRTAWRWARRGFFAWQAVGRVKTWLAER